MSSIFIGFATHSFFNWGYAISFLAFHFCRFEYAMLFDGHSVQKTVDLTGRGAGYWRWKPLIIIRAMDYFPRGVIVYSDMGRSMRYLPYLGPSFIRSILKKNGVDFIPGVFIPDAGPNKNFTKKKVFEKLDMLSREYLMSPQLQASWSVWSVTENSRHFVSEWDLLCAKIDLINDENNIGIDSDYKDHRHDQSLLTLNFIKIKPKSILRPSNSFNFDKSYSAVLLQCTSKYWVLLFKILEMLRKRISNLKQWAKRKLSSLKYFYAKKP